MILLLAGPPYQPVLVNSALVISVITGPVFGTALVAHLSSQPQPRRRWDSVERGSAETPTLCHCHTPHKNTQYVHTFKRGHHGENAPLYANSEKLSKPDIELKLTMSIKDFVLFMISVITTTTHNVSVWTWPCSLIWNYYRNYSVTLLIINLHSLLPAGRQVVSLCFSHARPRWELWCWDGFCSCGEEGTEDEERKAGSISTCAVETYLYKHWQTLGR